MIKIWEGLDNKNLSKKNNLIMFKAILKLSNLRRIGEKLKKNYFQRALEHLKKNYKFPLLEKKDIYNRVKKLTNALEINEKINCDLISNRTILIRKS